MHVGRGAYPSFFRQKVVFEHKSLWAYTNFKPPPFNYTLISKTHTKKNMVGWPQPAAKHPPTHFSTVSLVGEKQKGKSFYSIFCMHLGKNMGVSYVLNAGDFCMRAHTVKKSFVL